MFVRSIVSGLVLSAALASACSDEDVFESPETQSSSTVGSGGASSNASGAGATGGGGVCDDLGDVCTTCELKACPELYCGCYQNGECGLLATCVLACPAGDTGCIQDCYTLHPDGISDGALLVDCAATDCPMGCPGYQPLDACTLCLYQKCPSQMNTCVANAACTQLLVCVDACKGDETCNNGCYTDYPAGLNDAGAVGTCLTANCDAQCAQ